jgi:hypothetical protein
MVALEHAWQDSSGWHSEVISSESSMALHQSSILIDTKGQINVFFSAFNGNAVRKPELLQRNINGWKSIPIPIDETRFYAPSLAMDLQGQIHLAYIDAKNYSIVYVEKQAAGWKTIIVDSGDYMGGHSIAALAFDQNGDLHASFYSDVGVRYVSKKDGTWRDELVQKGNVSSWDDPIYLLFDQQNQPHIFYWNQGSPSYLIHAFKNQTGWVNEIVPQPVKRKMYSDEWSRPVISPEGWPVLLCCANSPAYLVYRMPGGWQEKALDIQLVASPFSVLSYSSHQIASADGNLTMPYILFSSPPIHPTNLTYEVKFRDLQQNKDRLLPDFGYEIRYLGFKALETPVFLKLKRDIGNSTGDDLRIVTFRQSAWEIYQINFYSPYIPVPSLDANENVHLVDKIESCKNNSPCSYKILYLVGTGSDWKTTEVNGTGLPSQEFNITAVALHPASGQFCIMFYEYRRNNAVSVGCIENLE